MMGFCVLLEKVDSVNLESNNVDLQINFDVNYTGQSDAANTGGLETSGGATGAETGSVAGGGSGTGTSGSGSSSDDATGGGSNVSVPVTTDGSGGSGGGGAVGDDTTTDQLVWNNTAMECTRETSSLSNPTPVVTPEQ